MNLYTKPPEVLEIGGEVYKIDPDFRVWVRVYCDIVSNRNNEQKAIALGRLLQGMQLPLTEESVLAAIRFFACGNSGSGSGGDNKPPCFDFEKDSEYIYSAFLNTYSIDLTTAKLHWWEFMALFRSLPEECQMCKIMHYRAVKLSDVPKSQKKFYEEMKTRYSLTNTTDKKPKTAQEHEEEMKQRAQKLYEQAKSQMSAMRRNEQSSNDC